MQLALGTAQFGLDYGVTNHCGAVDLAEIRKILNYARNNSILTIDTASVYGNSEDKLGEAADLSDFQIITKTPPNSPTNIIEKTFFESLDKLKIRKIHGLLIHSANDLLSLEGDKIWKLLENLKSKKLVEKIGVSVYTETEIKEVLKKYEIDLIQLPLNVFDQRLLKTGILEEIKKKGIEIHARSLFLQGILLENPENLSPYFNPYKEQIINWYNFLKNNNLTPLEGALGFAASLNLIDCAVIGITSLKNIIEIKTVFDKMKSISTIEYLEFAINDEKLINPTIWKI